MIAETYAYKALIADAELNALFDEIRGAPFPDEDIKQGIFTYDIPEQPTNFKKREYAPFLRINTSYDNAALYADDVIIADEQRIVINFWAETAAQSDKIIQQLDKVLLTAKFERYTSNETPRYKDPDIDLIMNVRKYRVFDWQLKNLEVTK